MPLPPLHSSILNRTTARHHPSPAWQRRHDSQHHPLLPNQSLLTAAFQTTRSHFPRPIRKRLVDRLLQTDGCVISWTVSIN
ncbi:hypothetical protein TNCV_5033621 [Trichonephila clavipes]|nr:hypothetical protein TNCV_5033621 [Trichonephila clavipes]